MLTLIYSAKQKILIENLIFFVVTTTFLVIVGFAWRHLKPFELVLPLPTWFKTWFMTVQVVGGLLPLIVMVLWGLLWRHSIVLVVFISYFFMIILQGLCEIAILRWFHSITWIMIPYLYLPYRIWQLYEGLTLLNLDRGLIGVRNVLVIEIVLWVLNYAVNLSQLPRLFRWE
jgi:hypothetical protein